MISINAAFADCISNIEYHSNGLIPDFMLTKEVIIDNDTPKEELLKTISESVSYVIEGQDDYGYYITCKVKRTDEEIQKYKDDKEKNKLYSIKKLKKWYDQKEENKIQIEEYLKYKKLDWILDEIKGKHL